MSFDAIQSAELTGEPVGVAARCAEILESLNPSQAKQAILSARAVARTKNTNPGLKQRRIAELCKKIGLTEEDMQIRNAIIRSLAGMDETPYRQQIQKQILGAQVVR